MRMRGVAVQVQQKSRRRSQSDAAGDIRRAGLELVGQAVVLVLAKVTAQNHVAAALPRRHALEQRSRPYSTPMPVGPKSLWPEKA